MIKIAICDDENVIASQIENIIWNICKEENGNLMVPGTNGKWQGICEAAFFNEWNAAESGRQIGCFLPETPCFGYEPDDSKRWKRYTFERKD